MQGDHDPGKHDEITLVGVDDDSVDELFVERLAAYLEAELEHVSESRAIVRP